MRSRILAIFTFAALAMAPAAFGQKVKTDFDRSIDFSHYRTYAWKGCEAPGIEAGASVGFAHSRLRSAVNDQLVVKELAEVSENENPDLFLSCSIGEETKRQAWTSGFGPSWGGPYRRGYHRRGWGGGFGSYSSTTTITEWNEGNFVIEMVDAKDNTLVWRAVATARIDNNRKDEKRINNIAKKAFKKFPPPAPAEARNTRVAAD